MSEEQPVHICILCPTCKECIYDGDKVPEKIAEAEHEHLCTHESCKLEKEAKMLKEGVVVTHLIQKLKPRRGGGGRIEDESKNKECPNCKENKFKEDSLFKGSWKCNNCGYIEFKWEKNGF